CRRPLHHGRNPDRLRSAALDAPADGAPEAAEPGGLVRAPERAPGLQEARRHPAVVSKIAIITGGASGIGLACAERLASDGMKVVIADMNEKTGAEHAKRLGGDFVL